MILGAPLLLLVVGCLLFEELVLGALLGAKLLYNLLAWRFATKRRSMP